MKILNKKVLIILLISLLLFFSFSTVYAFSYTTSDGTEVMLDDNFINYAQDYMKGKDFVCWNDNGLKILSFDNDISNIKFYPVITNGNIRLYCVDSIIGTIRLHCFDSNFNYTNTYDFNCTNKCQYSFPANAFYCTFDIYNDVNFDTFFYSLNFSEPAILDDDNTLSNFSGSYFLIKSNSIDVTTQNLEFTIDYKGPHDDIITRFGTILLDTFSKYYNCVDNEVFFEVPYSAFTGNSVNYGGTIIYNLTYYDSKGEIHILTRELTSLRDFTFTDTDDSSGVDDNTNAIIDSNKETQNAIQEQTEAIKENNETNKGIFDTLKEVLSYINPLSENFFVYKLIELLIEAIKSLFVPKDNFFSTYFDEIKEWFSARLGFLWTPFDVVLEILDRILNINFSEPIFSIPNINEPFTNKLLISSNEFNLNSLLDNDILKNMHDIYFICVDAIIIFALVNLAKKKIEEVFNN